MPMIIVCCGLPGVALGSGLIAVVSWPMILKKSSTPGLNALEMAVLWKVQLLFVPYAKLRTR